MKNQKNTSWVGLSDKNNDPEFIEATKQEFVELPILEAAANEDIAEGSESNRRDFLKYLGFGLGAATIAASCETPVRRAIPYVVKPDAIVPGVASYYASTFVNGGDYCPILVKTREGRPIKIEGNSMSSMTMGGTSARAQASVLGLYDINRAKSPRMINKDSGDMEDVSWEALDRGLKGRVDANTVILTNTVMSPTTKKVFQDLGAKVVTYDPISSSAMLEANEECFGEKAI